MKKILFILPSLAVGGLEHVQVNIANTLAERGYNITIIALNPYADLLPQLDKRVRYIHKPYKQHKIMKKIPYIRNKFYDDGMWETRASSKKLYKYYVGKERYDIEIAFFRGLPIKIISGSTNNDSVKLAWVHSDFRKAVGYKNNFKNMQAVKDAYEKFDKIVCVSIQAKVSFESVIGLSNKTVVINNLMPISDIQRKFYEQCDIPKNKIVFLTIGHFIEVKGYERLLRVVKMLSKEYAFELWMIGFGNNEIEYRKYIAENKLENILILGKQDNPYKYMRLADVYICSSFYEGFPLTVAEAIINGMAVVSTNCAGTNEMLDNGKYGLIVENSEEGLYHGIKMFLDNPEKIQYYKEKARERLDFFNEEKIINKITELFE